MSIWSFWLVIFLVAAVSAVHDLRYPSSESCSSIRRGEVEHPGGYNRVRHMGISSGPILSFASKYSRGRHCGTKPLSLKQRIIQDLTALRPNCVGDELLIQWNFEVRGSKVKYEGQKPLNSNNLETLRAKVPLKIIFTASKK